MKKKIDTDELVKHLQKENEEMKDKLRIANFMNDALTVKNLQLSKYIRELEDTLPKYERIAKIA